MDLQELFYKETGSDRDIQDHNGNYYFGYVDWFESKIEDIEKDKAELAKELELSNRELQYNEWVNS